MSSSLVCRGSLPEDAGRRSERRRLVRTAGVAEPPWDRTHCSGPAQPAPVGTPPSASQRAPQPTGPHDREVLRTAATTLHD